MHLLRLLRRGLPGIGDLHGQGLRARGLQQQGLHLGQAGTAGPRRRRRDVFARTEVTETLHPAPPGRGAFLETLSERVLVCDGAMGTLLYAKGVFLNRCFDELNLTQPGLVSQVHDAYVQAGADVLETNTFGANRTKLGPFGLSDETHAINVAGATLARRAAGESVFVAGAVGPLGVRIEPWGRMGVDEAESVFREQAAALSQGGVDLFILETFRDVNELTAAVRAVRSVS